MSPDKELQSSGTHWAQDHHLSLLSTCPSQFHVVPSWWVDDEPLFSSHHLQHTFNSINYLHFCILWLIVLLKLFCIQSSPDLWQCLSPSLYLLSYFFPETGRSRLCKKAGTLWIYHGKKYIVLPSIPSMMICNIRSFHFWSISSIELMFLIELPVW